MAAVGTAAAARRPTGTRRRRSAASYGAPHPPAPTPPGRSYSDRGSYSARRGDFSRGRDYYDDRRDRGRDRDYDDRGRDREYRGSGRKRSRSRERDRGYSDPQRGG